MKSKRKNFDALKLKTPDPIPGRASITEHEGNKYLREITAATDDTVILIDVYCVLDSFDVTCQATGHAIKKLLCAGLRGKGSRLADLVGAMAALNRAIDQEQQRMGRAAK